MLDTQFRKETFFAALVCIYLDISRIFVGNQFDFMLAADCLASAEAEMDI